MSLEHLRQWLHYSTANLDAAGEFNRFSLFDLHADESLDQY
jgi:hypothetical protein